MKRQLAITSVVLCGVGVGCGIGQYHFSKAPQGVSTANWDDYCANIPHLVKTVQNDPTAPVGSWAGEDGLPGDADSSTGAVGKQMRAVSDLVQLYAVAQQQAANGGIPNYQGQHLLAAIQTMPSCKP